MDNIDIENIAKLARLDLNDSAKEQLKNDMRSVLTYVEQIQELNVDGIEPTAHAAPLTNVIRDDVAKETFPREIMLANSPKTIEDELIRVPKVLPNEEGGA